MKTIREWLYEAEKMAESLGKEDSAIKLLMQHATNKESYELLLDFDEVLPGEQSRIFETNVHKYLNENLPIQHLIGHETFYGHKFIVNSDVLIPRFETEELVSKVLELYDDHFDNQEIDVVDVGCGCGAIGLSLKIEEPRMSVTLTDISQPALDVAIRNASELNVEVTFTQSDMLDELVKQKRKFDILVSNPPYIPQEEEVDSLVFDNEPHVALFGGIDGLYFYRKILHDARKILKNRNLIAFEHAFHHREGMAKLINEYFPQSKFETIKDMQGKDRMTVILNL